MDEEDLMFIALAAGIAYFVFRAKRASSANTVNNIGQPVNGIAEIFTGAMGGALGSGWRYFTDGTAIDPAGNYYSNGQLVWSPK